VFDLLINVTQVW